MHAVTAASGSSPVYFFQLLEAMQQGLIHMGLNDQQVRELVQQAMQACMARSKEMETLF
ncbi:hypothetical protein FXB73_00210 [Aggregatibacter actinomycetemcomitans]|nr:hypothetical protein FXB73_00210 [Aggregatibacter actinomycetemcomitans]